MLRYDGDYVIYTIQHWVPNGVGRKVAQWDWTSFDHFGHVDGMTANDRCWQETGIDGTYDPDIADAGLANISARHPKRKFRIVSVHITQITKLCHNTHQPKHPIL